MKNFNTNQLKRVFIYFALLFLCICSVISLKNAIEHARKSRKSQRMYTVSTPEGTISVPMKQEYKEAEKDYAYSFAWEVQRAVDEGQPISEAIADMDPAAVWLNIDELLAIGATIEEIHDHMPPETVWLRVTELLQNGYDADKLVDELYEDGSLPLVVGELKANGYDIDKIKDKIQ